MPRLVPGRLLLAGVQVALLAMTILFAADSRMDFEPPGPEARRQAIGPTDSLPPAMRAALDPDAGFKPIPKPGPNDWLANHPEQGQTFAQFLASRPHRPDAQRRVLYLQPLGPFAAEASPSLEKLTAYAAAFFQMEVKALPPINLQEKTFTARTNAYTHQRQILTADVLEFLRPRLPEDAYCLLAVTMADLYPEPSWNFVFGQASLRERVGVYSFARYDPAFYGAPRGADYPTLLLRRSCKVLAHETAHMFGLLHCIYFDCLMNGSNHLQESDRRPMHLCPVCLRKLQSSGGWDVQHRYQALERFYRQAGFAEDARWTAERLDRLAHASQAPHRS